MQKTLYDHIVFWRGRVNCPLNLLFAACSHIKVFSSLSDLWSGFQRFLLMWAGWLGWQVMCTGRRGEEHQPAQTGVKWSLCTNCTHSEGRVSCLVSAITSLCDFVFHLNEILTLQWSLFEKMPECAAPAPGEWKTHAQRWPACSLRRGSPWQLLGDPPVYLLFLQPTRPPSHCPILPSTSLLLCRLAGRTRQ